MDTAAADLLTNMGLVAGIVETLKRAIGPSFSSERFGPLLALSVGVGVAIGGRYAGWYDTAIGNAIFQGIIAGLSASGLQRTVTRQA
jgi:hypothetical protein